MGQALALFKRLDATVPRHEGAGASLGLPAAANAAQAVRSVGADVRAATAWALLCLHNWSSMLHEHRGHYEPGAFDTSKHPPQRTLLADAVMALANEGRFTHPALLSPGWWRREDRILCRARLA